MIGIPALLAWFGIAQWPATYLNAVRSLAGVVGPFGASLIALWTVTTVVGEGTA